MGYPSFNTGDVLAAADMNAVGLWRLAERTPAGTSTQVRFENVFSSSYRNYLIVVQNLTASAGELRFQFIDNTTDVPNNYYSAATIVSWTGSPAASGQANSGAQYICGFTNGTNYPVSFTMNVYGPMIATARTAISHQGFSYWDNAASGAGFHNVADDYSGFRIFHATSNLTGNIKVYGYRD